MECDGSGVSALVGLNDFVVSAQVLDEASGVVAGGADQRGAGLVSGLWGAGGWPWPAAGGGAGSALGGSSGGAGVGQALVALPRTACSAGTWSEESDAIAPRAVLTERARAEIARRVGPDEHSVAEAARDFGVSWHTAMAQCEITDGPGSITSLASAPLGRLGWTRPRSWPRPRRGPGCW